MKPIEYNLDDDIVAIATPLSPSALAVIRTSGNHCFNLLSKVFSRPAKLKEAKGSTTLYGWILDLDKENKIDEVMLCLYKSPKSFTGEDSIEIISHGGISVVQEIYKQLIKAGFRPAEGGEFTFRAFINGKTDLTRAEAVKEIIDAKTQTAAKNAANRLSGNLFTEIVRIKNLILQTLAAIHVEIEYPEDEETTEGSFDSTKIKEATNSLTALVESWAGEKIFQDGAKIVLAGKTNAGKSRLFNTLLKEERSIVSDIHGTTRDWIDAHCNFNGIPVRIYDTAGLRFSDDTIEKVGIERTKIIVENADLIFYLLDSSNEADKDDIDFLQKFSNCNQDKILLVRTKNDLQKAPKNKELEKVGLNKIPVVSISAKTMSGVSELINTAYSRLTLGLGVKKEIALGSERQKNSIEEALHFLRHSLKAAETGFPLDAISQDLEDALHCLAEITGEARSDDVLNRIFSDFCVGK
ncbi:MAG: tRNA uridine-5-carboxymethylaminomethyl(34) synthesis GTPase MnmE [Treponema sp.]|nr:MAG: tRNA uridine-5-carboxymethylaminomethyl(34) synthesis GTPase MnmE [Treponema sp.]